MSNFFEPGKFAKLRRKTDRQLMALIENDLERGFRLARRPTSENLAKAENACAEAALLAPRVYNLGELERQRLKIRIGELRDVLDALASGSQQQMRAAGC